MVVAIIQPQQLPAVKEALFDAGIKHLTVTNVLGTAPEGAEPSNTAHIRRDDQSPGPLGEGKARSTQP